MSTCGYTRALALSAVTALAATALTSFAPPAGAAGALSLRAASADGAAFDLDEAVDGDLTVQATEAGVGDVDVDDAQDLEYFWTITPFAGGSPTRVPATGQDVVADDVAGEFVVPLPTGGVPGTYTLSAGLVEANADVIASRSLLVVKTGHATLRFADASPLEAEAGLDRPVAGTLRLEDGTGLPGRLLDLHLDRGTTGSDAASADAGFRPASPATEPVPDTQATTDAQGSFTVVLSDPAEAGQGTELGGRIGAATAVTPDLGDADASAALDVDLITENPPADATVAIGGLGRGTPGRALDGQVTITAPDNTFDTDATKPGVQGDADSAPDPVSGQRYTLTVDRGFFTTGAERLPSVVGAPAGNLTNLGATLTGLTDVNGQVAFKIAIERDGGFDDDGQVAATVTGRAGSVTGRQVAAWDSGTPLNGGRIQVVVAPQSEQAGPVQPAVAGTNTNFDVFATDQFGNAVVGAPVKLAYSGDLNDWDYSDDSLATNTDSFGDFWIVSFKPASINVSASWDAPALRYVDTAGNTTVGTSTVSGANTASFYDFDFSASKFALTSSATGMTAIGTAVTHTVTVLDQRGNPVSGYEVQFFRDGPDKNNNSGEPRVSRVTNARGQATYTFVGTEPGRAKVTAEITDGEHSQILTSTVAFGLPVPARLTTKGNGAGRDELKVKVPRAAAGAKVTIFRIVKGGRKAVGRRKLDKTGRVEFAIRDRNRKRFTTYVAEVRATASTLPAVSNTAKVR